MQIVVVVSVRGDLCVKNGSESFLHAPFHPQLHRTGCPLDAVCILAQIILIVPVGPGDVGACTRYGQRGDVRLGKNSASFAVDYLVAGNFVAECRTVYHTIEERTASIGGVCRSVIELEMGDSMTNGLILLRCQELLRLKRPARDAHRIHPAVERVESGRTAAELPSWGGGSKRRQRIRSQSFARHLLFVAIQRQRPSVADKRNVMPLAVVCTRSVFDIHLGIVILFHKTPEFVIFGSHAQGKLIAVVSDQRRRPQDVPIRLVERLDREVGIRKRHGRGQVAVEIVIPATVHGRILIAVEEACGVVCPVAVLHRLADARVRGRFSIDFRQRSLFGKISGREFAGQNRRRLVEEICLSSPEVTIVCVRILEIVVENDVFVYRCIVRAEKFAEIQLFVRKPEFADFTRKVLSRHCRGADLHRAARRIGKDDAVRRVIIVNTLVVYKELDVDLGRIARLGFYGERDMVPLVVEKDIGTFISTDAMVVFASLGIDEIQMEAQIGVVGWLVKVNPPSEEIGGRTVRLTGKRLPIGVVRIDTDEHFDSKRRRT